MSKERKVRRPASTDPNLYSSKTTKKKDSKPKIRGDSDNNPISFRKRNTKGPDMSSFKGLFKKDLKGYDDKVFKSITGDTVGTAAGFKKAGRMVPDYNYNTMDDTIDSWMKKGGSIKKNMKKVKVSRRAALRGQRKELRGF